MLLLLNELADELRAQRRLTWSRSSANLLTEGWVGIDSIKRLQVRLFRHPTHQVGKGLMNGTGIRFQSSWSNVKTQTSASGCCMLFMAYAQPFSKFKLSLCSHVGSFKAMKLSAETSSCAAAVATRCKSMILLRAY